MVRISVMETDQGSHPVQRQDQLSRLQDRTLQVAQEFWNRNDPDQSLKIPLVRVKERLLETQEADSIPNALVVQLLKKADKNSDGFIDYEEYMQFADASAEYSRSREVLNKAALSVVPRGERTVEKRTYLQEYRCCPPALFMITASLAEIGVFVYYAIDMGVTVGSFKPIPTYSQLVYDPYRRYEAWRYLTYGLIHSGYVHLVTNLVMQLVLGLLLELVHGWWRVGIIYLAGVLAGSLLQSVTDPNYYIVGASGGVYGIAYAHLGNLMLNWSEMSFRWVQLILCLAVIIADVGVILWDLYGTTAESNIGHMAHLGGAIAGALVGINILRNLKKRQWERYCWWAALVVYLALMAACVALNMTLPVPDYYPPSDYSELAERREKFIRRFR